MAEEGSAADLEGAPFVYLPDVPEGMRVPSIEFGRLVAKGSKGEGNRAMLVPLVTLVFGVVQGVRFGIMQSDYLWLAISGLVCTGTVLAYHLVVVMFASSTRRPRWFALPLLGGVLPFVLGFYLFGMRGVWKLVHLREGFSTEVFLSGLVFSVMGGLLLGSMRRLTELSQEVERAVKLSRQGLLERVSED